MTIIDTATADVRPASQATRRPSASLLGGVSLLVRRRLWRDRVLLFSSAVIVALATLLAYAGPQMVASTIDAGARDAVVLAGSGADVVVTLPVGNESGDNLNSVPGVDPGLFDSHAQTIEDNLPTRVADLVDSRESWVLSPQIPFQEIVEADERAQAEADDREAEARPRAGDSLQLGFSEQADMTLVDGRMPADPSGEAPAVEPGAEPPPPEAIEIAVTPAVADSLGVGVGDLVTVTNALQVEVEFDIVGIVEPADPAAAVWDLFPQVTEPSEGGGEAEQPVYRRGTVMVSAATLAAVTERFNTPYPGTVYFEVGTEGLTLNNSRGVAADMTQLRSQSSTLLPNGGVTVSVDSDLAEALQAYPPRARAALAQMSVIVAGVVAVAAVVIALMARLLLSRRENDISLERARGASVPSMALRLILESALFTAVGVTAGYFAATAVVGEVDPTNTTVVLVAVVAVVASPLLGTLMARRTWTGRREPANRTDRAKIRKARAARRLTLEALAVVLGVLAVVTLRGRGVLQTQTSGVDPFLAAAPVLLALAVTVVVIRLYPIPMAIIQFFAKRTRGVAGVITLAKARERIPVLPLLALTLAIAVAVSSGLLVGTVSQGQEQASWERVGGQVRVDAEIDDETVSALSKAGVDVSQVYLRDVTQYALGRAYEDTALLAVDSNYAEAIDAAGIDDVTELRELAAANEARGEDEPIPVLVSEEFIDLDFGGRSQIFVGRSYVDVEILGPITVAPDGWLDGPYVIMPLEALMAQELESEIAPNLFFVTGDNAEQVVENTTAIPTQAVSTRSQWLTAARESALIGGVERLMTIAVVAVAVLAAVALLVTVLQGVRARGRALSMFRTQGMSNAYGWWLALSELAPLTVAAVVGGAGAGLIILALLGSTLGLEILAGGIEAPELVADPVFLGAVAAGVGVLLFVAVAAEVIAHRRNKLSEVLRFGETR